MIARVWKAFREKETGGGRGMSDCVHACACVCVSVCAFATPNEEEQQLLIVAGFDKGKHIC